MPQSFGFVFVKSVFVPESDAFRTSMTQYTSALQQLGGEVCTETNMNDFKPLVYFMTTGGTEQVLLNIRAQRRRVARDEPVFIVAHPTQNSLPAALEVLARLQQEGAQGQVLYLDSPDDQVGLQKIERVLSDFAVAAELKCSRIGLVGAPSDWLVASSPEPATVREAWGPEVIPIDMAEINKLMGEVTQEMIPAIREPLIANAVKVQEPSPRELDDVIRVYLALKKMIEFHELDALSLRCFDLVLGLQTTGCFALSQLADEGIVAGCEGDLMSTVGMLWVSKLLGEIPWMANPAQLDEVNNTLWLAHCTVPRSMVQNYELRSHFESGLGVGIQGTLSNGLVTLVRLGGKNMKQLWLGEGAIIQTGQSEDLCRTQAEISLSRGHISDLLETPLGNHLVMVRGHHLNRLQAWWKQMIV